MSKKLLGCGSLKHERMFKASLKQTQLYIKKVFRLTFFIYRLVLFESPFQGIANLPTSGQRKDGQGRQWFWPENNWSIPPSLLA